MHKRTWLLVPIFVAGCLVCYMCSSPIEPNDPYRPTVSDVDPPVNVSASDSQFLDRIEIRWDTCPGVDSFRVFRYDSEGNSYTQIAATSRTAFADTAVGLGIYYYKLRSYSSSRGESQFSKYDAGSLAQFRAPTGVSASDFLDEETISVHWRPVRGVSQYDIYRSESIAVDAYSILANTSDTFFVDDSAVANCRRYYYRVSSYFAKHDSIAFSDIDSGIACPIGE